VADEVRQPVAIRITRPFSSEEEFLAHEIDTLTRTSVTLIGAQSRPPGVILRFEVVLTDGSPLMRGEGRVIAFQLRTLGDLSGLTLRFTRLDKKTKALVDRAAQIREDRARAALRASMESELPPPPSEPAAPPSLHAGPPSNGHTAPPPSNRANPEPTGGHEAYDGRQAGVNGLLLATPAPPPPPSAPSERIIYRAAEREPTPSQALQETSQETSQETAGPRDRDSLLLRLRERARGLAPETVDSILHALPTSSQE